MPSTYLTRSACFSLLALGLFGSLAAADNWTRFRGPNGTGIVEKQDLPVQFDEKSGILWKVKVPGLGHSSPIVWDSMLFLQTSIGDDERQLLCFDVRNGKQMWSASFHGAKAKIHPKSSLASSTPATDGERVYVVFWDGSGQTGCAYDFKGNQLWTHDFGPFKSQHGAGASPIVHDGKVFFTNDQDGQAALIALNAKDGKTAWESNRKAFRACSSTPFIRTLPGGGSELVVDSTAGITGYDPATGKENWDWSWPFAKMALRTVGSPVFAHGIVYATSGDGSGERNMVAVKADKKPELVWNNRTAAMPYVPSLLAHGDHLFFVNDKGIAGCFEAATGKQIWYERLNGEVSASPILVDGKIYAVTEQGDVLVLKAGPKFEVLGRSSVDDVVTATPAVADGKMYIRSKSFLYCVGKAR